jgi:hypothetical protein
MFWLESGFEGAGTELLQTLPASFVEREGQHWLSLKLRENPSAALSLDKELEVFRQAQREQSEKIVRQAKALRTVAALVVTVVLVLIGLAAWLTMQRLHRGPGL